MNISFFKFISFSIYRDRNKYRKTKNAEFSQDTLGSFGKFDIKKVFTCGFKTERHFQLLVNCKISVKSNIERLRAWQPKSIVPNEAAEIELDFALSFKLLFSFGLIPSLCNYAEKT